MERAHLVNIMTLETSLGTSTGRGSLAIWTPHLKDIQFFNSEDPHFNGKAIPMSGGVAYRADKIPDNPQENAPPRVSPPDTFNRAIYHPGSRPGLRMRHRSFLPSPPSRNCPSLLSGVAIDLQGNINIFPFHVHKPTDIPFPAISHGYT